jgi:GTP-binding protein HflX
VLGEIDAGDLPQLKIYNKLDLLPDQQPRIDRDESGRPIAVWLSAHTGAGLDLLLQALSECLGQKMIAGQLLLGNNMGRLRAKLYELSVVDDEVYGDDGRCELTISITSVEFYRLMSIESIVPEHLEWRGAAPRLI